jgi:transposase-like protein
VQSPLDDPGWLSSLTETEERCRRFLEVLRWPEGICCPRCDGRSINLIRARRRFYCRGCRQFFSLTSGTIFHNSHLPIWKWFVAITLILDSDRGLPANELRMLLGGSYKTAWFVEHRIRAAICEATKTPRTTSSIHNEPDSRTYARPFVGPHHQFALKYLPAYVAERSWRRRWIFLCECGAAECAVWVDLDLDEYAARRADPDRMILAPGHAAPSYAERLRRDAAETREQARAVREQAKLQLTRARRQLRRARRLSRYPYL